MIKLLIPALIITICISVLWFFLYPEREKNVSKWLIDKKEEIFQGPEIPSVKHEGYQFLEYEFASTYNNNKKWRLQFIKVNPKDFDFQLIMNKKDQLFAISDIAEEYDCKIAINGIFFDKNFNSLGLVVEDGKIVNSAHSGELATGIFYVSENKEIGIIQYSDYKLDTDDIALQAGPLLLKYDGSTEITNQGQEIDSRTIIAIDIKNNLYLGIIYPKVEKNLVGASLYELAEVLVNSEEKLGVKMKAVLNLDGGSSTGLYTEDFYFAEKNLPQNVLCLVKR